MTTIAKPASPTNSDRMHEIEGRHFGRCIDQVWDKQRLTLIELMEHPKARGGTAVIVKRYETPVPRMGASKPWPDLMATYVYVELDDPTNTWDGLDQALTAFADQRKKTTT